MFKTCRSQNDVEEIDSSEPALLFQSGFEDNCSVVSIGNNDDIIGSDATLSEKK